MAVPGAFNEQDRLTPDLWNELERLYARAVEMLPLERERYLKTIENADIQRELESLLRCSEEPDFIETPAFDLAAKFYVLCPTRSSATLPIDESEHDGEDLIGRTIEDRFVVEALIDRGGFGRVYKGTHRWTRQPVAIKRLAPQYRYDPEYRDRLFKEGQL